MEIRFMKISNIISRRNRILLRELVVTDFKLRYQGSVLGYLWSVLKPLFLFVIMFIVFDKILGAGKDVEHYPVYLLLGIVLWTFFTESTIQGLQSIVSRGDLIRKINFPKYIIVISGTISALINLLINLAVVLVFCVINGVEFHLSALLVPIFIIELYVFALAVAFFLAALNAKFRDVGYLWDIFLQAAFYTTPILYPLQMVIEKSELAAKILMLNPIAQVIQDIRYNLVTHTTIRLEDLVHGWKLLIPFILLVVISVVAGWYFKRSQKNFAEEV